MDRNAFVAAIVEELKRQQAAERSPGPARDPAALAREGYEALCFDMPLVPPAAASALADTLLAALSRCSAAGTRRASDSASSGGDVLGQLPPWFELTPRVVASVVHCGERAGAGGGTTAPPTDTTASSLGGSGAGTADAVQPTSQPASVLAAVVLVKLTRAVVCAPHAASAGSAAPSYSALLCEAPLPWEVVAGVEPHDWERLTVTTDACDVVQQLVTAPTELSRHWTKYLYLLRDAALARPPLAAGIVAALLALTAALPRRSLHDVAASYVQRTVLSAVVDVLDSAAVSGAAPVQRAFLSGMRTVGPVLQGTVQRVYALVSAGRPSAPDLEGFSDSDLSRDCARDVEVLTGVVRALASCGGPAAVQPLLPWGVLGPLTTLALAAPSSPLYSPAVTHALRCLHELLPLHAELAAFAAAVPGMAAFVTAPEPLPAAHRAASALWPLLFAAASSPRAAVAPAVQPMLDVGLTRLRASVSVFESAFIAAEGRGDSDAKPVYDALEVALCALNPVLDGLQAAAPVLQGCAPVWAAVLSTLAHLNGVLRRVFPVLPAPVTPAAAAGGGDIPPPDPPLSWRYVSGGKGKGDSEPLAEEPVAAEEERKSKAEGEAAAEGEEEAAAEGGGSERDRADEDAAKARGACTRSLTLFNRARAATKVLTSGGGSKAD